MTVREAVLADACRLTRRPGCGSGAIPGRSGPPGGTIGPTLRNRFLILPDDQAVGRRGGSFHAAQ
jgi:hypothetical protein